MRQALFTWLLIFLLGSIYAEEQKDEPQKTIGIFTFRVQGMEPWDPRSVKTGINGSEEAIIYVAEKLANLGYKVTIFGNPPSDSPYLSSRSNPRYLPVEYNDGTVYDIAIAWRSPWNGISLKNRAKAVYLWPHDISVSSFTPEQVLAFDDVLWLSEWQRAQWISLCPLFSLFTNIYGNGIIAEQFEPVKERKNPHSCIYGSNYARGLNILLDNWPFIHAAYPDATLDIYYGWRTWGLLSPHEEAYMKKQIAELSTAGVVEHGQVGHDELNRAYEKASIWAYPCTQDETFCITALRAELAGAIPVIVEGSALTETVRHGYKCTQPSEYLPLILTAMRQAENISIEDRKAMGNFVLKEFTWDAVADKWKKTFDKIANTKKISKLTGAESGVVNNSFNPYAPVFN